MIKLRLFWLWPVIIIWDHAKWHVHRNPTKRNVTVNIDGKKVYEGTLDVIYPPAGE